MYIKTNKIIKLVLSNSEQLLKVFLIFNFHKFLMPMVMPKQ